MPCEGHLDAIFWIYLYLKYKKNSLIVYSPTYPVVDEDNFPKRNWDNFYYGKVDEQLLPTMMPTPRGPEIIMRLFV